MKKTLLSLLLLMICIVSTTLFAQNKTQVQAAKSTVAISGYYFHFTSRCVTCKAVEAEAKKDLAELYGNRSTFQSLNLDDKSSEPMAEKLNVSGQTLLVVVGGKQVNLTNEGFMYARSNPTKFKAIIKEKVDALLK